MAARTATNTLTLKVDGDKLTGSMTSPGRNGSTSTDIKDGKVSGSDISFSVTREFNGNSFTTKYSGKVGDDFIRGKIEFDRNGETQSRDWEAKKQEEKKADDKKIIRFQTIHAQSQGCAFSFVSIQIGIFFISNFV
ncbi:MAG: hypothetical protein WDM76_10725 [Limisphaerales bacterium]